MTTICTRIKFLLTALVVTLATASCVGGCESSDTPAVRSSVDTSLLHLSGRAHVFQQFDERPTDSDPLRIDSAYTVGSTLALKVSYRGGCGPHAFDLAAWSRFEIANPPHGKLYLSQHDSDDHCSHLVTEELMFDLTPLVVRYRESRHYAGPVRLYIYPAADTTRATVATLDVP